ncbi:MAG: ATP-dependent sacrificial sulfur transferase LarE [Nitrospinae bacterium]|nr:ATP-dependent sacrificial sulfur transferase LarE [Nitrospinota bacterium]
MSEDTAIAEPARQKLVELKKRLASLGSALIAFSGGVDSSFLLKVAFDTLGIEKTMAVTARSSTYPKRELDEAVSIAKLIGARHVVIESEELEIEGFAQNPVNRCYFCKGELFGKLSAMARDQGLAMVLDGANADDLKDHRPGAQAARESGVLSLLQETGFTKQDIRILSRNMGLPTWNKPSFACLASRFPYGTTITFEKLGMVERAEDFLRGLGFTQLRVRAHGDVARLELAPQEASLALQPQTAETIYAEFRKIGFKYVAVDIKGYRTGSMNETVRP